MNREGIDIMRNYIEVICLREIPETECNIYKIIIVNGVKCILGSRRTCKTK
jgi:hypothetical protein